MSTSETPQKPPAALPYELRACTGFLLARVGLGMKQAALEEFERQGFSMYQFSVLAILAEGAKETQASIADTLMLDRGQLVGVLDELEQEGLIERRRDTTDRRRHTVSLTPAGRKRLVKVREIVAKVEDSFLGSLDAKARKALHDSLLQVAADHDLRFSGG